MRTTRALQSASSPPQAAPFVRGVTDAAPTVAGRILQAAWASEVVYGLWLAVAGPDHPEPAAVWRVPLLVLGIAMFAVTGGLLLRRRWALQASVALALPLVALAIWCFVADDGSHWVAEAVFAAAVAGGSLHPASWRMHVR